MLNECIMNQEWDRSRFHYAASSSSSHRSGICSRTESHGDYFMGSRRRSFRYVVAPD